MLPQELQTSPYITCVRPNEPPPVVYMTDPLAPERPDLTNLGDADFGVIGLDRQVVWQSDPAALVALETSAVAPVPTAELVARFGLDTVTRLFHRSWLQRPSDLCSEYLLRTGQIEVTAHCNWGCRFCPVATDPKPRETMPMPLFVELVEKLSACRTIKFVTFHFFNEPTLDKHFADRVEVLRNYGMKLSLFTNGSGFTEEKLKALHDSGVLYHLVFNLPTLDKVEFRSLTGSKTQDLSMRQIDNAIRLECFPISLSVNGIGESFERNLHQLKNRYEPQGVQVYGSATCDRAGAVENEYGQDVQIEGRLSGCSWPVNHAYFSVRGDIFICTNDYYQREVYGNIRDGSIHEIMTSPAAMKVRRRVFGVEEAPSDYICRSCHDQRPDFVERQFRPLATFPLTSVDTSGCGRSSGPVR